MPPVILLSSAFALWAAVLLASVPSLKLGLHLADQVAAPHLFISYALILLAWALGGPVAATVLSSAAGLVLIYLALATRDASYLMQAAFHMAFFVAIVYFLYSVQKTANDRLTAAEKIEGDINLVREEIERETARERSLGVKIDRFLNFQHFVDTLKDAPSPPAIAERIVREAHSVFPKAEDAALYVLDDQRHELERLAASGKADDPAAPFRGTQYDQWVLRRARPIVVEDTATDFRFFGAERASEGGRMRSLCSHPLMTENKVLGVLRVWSSRPDVFSSDDLRLLDVLAGIGAVTLRNKLLFDRMSDLAVHDSLTGLYRGGVFQEKLREEILRAERAGGVFSLVLLDIDYFKRYNDEYGHAAGDLVLKTLASLLGPCLGPRDWSARYGGEEIVVVSPGADGTKADALAEKIRLAVMSHRFALRKMTGTVTASFGVASYPADGRSAEEVFAAADKRLYQAKQSGRNRVCGATS